MATLAESRASRISFPVRSETSTVLRAIGASFSPSISRGECAERNCLLTQAKAQGVQARSQAYLEVATHKVGSADASTRIGRVRPHPLGGSAFGGSMPGGKPPGLLLSESGHPGNASLSEGEGAAALACNVEAGTLAALPRHVH